MFTDIRLYDKIKLVLRVAIKGLQIIIYTKIMEVYMYEIGPIMSFLWNFILIGTIISFVYHIIKKSKLSKRIFLGFISIMVAVIVALFIIFVLLMIEIL